MESKHFIAVIPSSTFNLFTLLQCVKNETAKEYVSKVSIAKFC